MILKVSLTGDKNEVKDKTNRIPFHFIIACVTIHSFTSKINNWMGQISDDR